jgi:hypothetical protein
MKWPRLILGRHEEAPLQLPTVIEISPEGISAAAFVVAEPVPRAAFGLLPPNQQSSEVGCQRLQETSSIAELVRDLLLRIAPCARSVAVLIPDLDVHTHMLEFDSLPASQPLAEAIVRLRLKKLIRINIDSAKVSFTLVSQNHERCKVLVVCIANNVLEKYENAVNMAGFRPGIILPNGVALSRSLKEKDPVLFAYVTADSITTGICSDDDLYLYRTIDLRLNQEGRVGEIDHALLVAVAYFEDLFKYIPKHLHLAISDDAQNLPMSFPDVPVPIVQLPNAAMGMAMAFANSPARFGKWN